MIHHGHNGLPRRCSRCTGANVRTRAPRTKGPVITTASRASLAGLTHSVSVWAEPALMQSSGHQHLSAGVSQHLLLPSPLLVDGIGRRRLGLRLNLLVQRNTN